MLIKSNKIHLFKFSKLIEVGGDDGNFEHPIFEDFRNFLSEEEFDLVGFTENEDIFVQLPKYKMDRFMSTFLKYGFEFDIIDVTQMVIEGKAQSKFPEVEELTGDFFKNFRLEYTSSDDVLDKILKNGINSLDDIDKYILKR